MNTFSSKVPTFSPSTNQERWKLSMFISWTFLGYQSYYNSR